MCNFVGIAVNDKNYKLELKYHYYLRNIVDITQHQRFWFQIIRRIDIKNLWELDKILTDICQKNIEIEDGENWPQSIRKQAISGMKRYSDNNDWYILTNKHVSDKNAEYKVILRNQNSSG